MTVCPSNHGYQCARATSRSCALNEQQGNKRDAEVYNMQHRSSAPSTTHMQCYPPAIWYALPENDDAKLAPALALHQCLQRLCQASSPEVSVAIV